MLCQVPIAQRGIYASFGIHAFCGVADDCFATGLRQVYIPAKGAHHLQVAWSRATCQSAGGVDGMTLWSRERTSSSGLYRSVLCTRGKTMQKGSQRAASSL